MSSILSHSHSQISLEVQDHQPHQDGHFHDQTQNDFFDQILSSAIPNCSWPPSAHDLSDPNSNPNGNKSSDSPPDNADAAAAFHHHQINGKTMLLQQQLHSALLSLPLSLATAAAAADSVDSHRLLADADGVHPSPFKSQGGGDATVQALYNGFAGSLHSSQAPNQQFHPGAAAQNYGGQGVMSQAQPASASTGGSTGTGTGAPSQKQNKPRARRGQATDPHSIAERLRRERIAERMKALQELVPNANKTDKASMLDEIIDYVKFLQLQVKVLSMSRLGGAAAVAPLVAEMSSEGGGAGRSSNGNQTGASSGNESSLTVTEHQVAKLMEEDMGSAMQYLQGKGLCLMPISLATAISTATCHNSRNNPLPPTLGRTLLNSNGNHDNHHNSNNNNNHSMSTSNGGGDHPSSVPSSNVPTPTSPTPSRD